MADEIRDRVKEQLIGVISPALSKKWKPHLEAMIDKILAIPELAVVIQRQQGFRFVSDKIARLPIDIEDCICSGDEQCRNARIWGWECKRITLGVLEEVKHE